MRRLLVGLITLLMVILLSGRSMAQSNVLSPDQRSVFAQMDPSLLGFWEGHGDGDGMKFDPQAIACMVNKCTILSSKHSTSIQLRDARNFQTCYDAHLARIRQPGYRRLVDPPPIYTLGCNVIAAQANSKDDRVFAAVNGRPRVQPATAKPRVKSRRVRLSPEEEAFLLAQMTRPLVDPSAASASYPANSAPPAPKAQPPRASSMPDDNPYKDDAPKAAPAKPAAPKVARVDDNPYKDDTAKLTAKPIAPKADATPVTTRRYGDLGENLVLVSANDTEAVIYVKPGGQFYTIRASYLAEKYEVDWKAVYTYAGNQYADFIGSCWDGNKVMLDADRMRARSYDRYKLMGPVDPDFMNACDGEFNFALQAGRTIALPIKGNVVAQAPPKEPDQPPAEQPKQAKVDESPPPVPSASAPMDSIEVPLEPPAPVASTSSPETGPAPAESVSALSPSAQPPPSDSAAINVTVNGKKRATPMTGHEFQAWFRGRPSTIALVALVLLLFIVIALYERRRSRRRKAGQAPPSTGWGAGPDEPTAVGRPRK
ncbi:MAG: hypothetical protein ACYC44_02340 [Patescibacteria group bacterium]